MTDLSSPHGLWLTVLAPDQLEALPTDGLGWLGVDLQHGRYAVADLPGLLRVARVPVLARAASGDPAHLGQVLDTGVAGVIVPSVTSAEGAAALVQAVRFPPEGVRSSGLTRAVMTGGPERPLLLPMVETAGALADVEAIAALPGVDGLFVGPYDLSLSLGRPGVTDAQVVAAIGRVHQACAQAGLLSGVFSGDRHLDPLLPTGLDLLALDTDVTVLRRGLEALLGDAGGR